MSSKGFFVRRPRRAWRARRRSRRIRRRRDGTTRTCVRVKIAMAARDFTRDDFFLAFRIARE
jgi:hypothetical protein